MATATPMAVTPVLLEGTVVRLEPLTAAHHAALTAVGLDEELLALVDRRRSAPPPTWLPTSPSRSPSRRPVERCRSRLSSARAAPWSGAPATAPSIGTTAVWRLGGPGSVGSGSGLRSTPRRSSAALARLRVAEVPSRRAQDRRSQRPSRAAILRLGAREEGIFRKHMITAGGRVRDTAYYAIVDDDWPAIKARLQARLSG